MGSSSRRRRRQEILRRKVEVPASELANNLENIAANAMAEALQHPTIQSPRTQQNLPGMETPPTLAEMISAIVGAQCFDQTGNSNRYRSRGSVYQWDTYKPAGDSDKHIAYVVHRVAHDGALTHSDYVEVDGWGRVHDGPHIFKRASAEAVKRLNEGGIKDEPTAASRQQLQISREDARLLIRALTAYGWVSSLVQELAPNAPGSVSERVFNLRRRIREACDMPFGYIEMYEPAKPDAA